MSSSDETPKDMPVSTSERERLGARVEELERCLNILAMRIKTLEDRVAEGPRTKMTSSQRPTASTIDMFD